MEKPWHQKFRDKETKGLKEIRSDHHIVGFPGTPKEFSRIVSERIKGSKTYEIAKRLHQEDNEYISNIYQKHKQGELLTKDDLIFLYEVDRLVQKRDGDHDPRIIEVINNRNVEEDILLVLSDNDEPLKPNQIAHMSSEISEGVIAFVGPLEPGIFRRIPESLKYLYTSFPGKRIKIESQDTSVKTAEEFIAELKSVGVGIFRVEEMIRGSYTFGYNWGLGSYRPRLVRIRISDLGFEDDVSLREIYHQASELGLEKCRYPTILSYCLNHKNDFIYNFIRFGMRPIEKSDGSQAIFGVYSTDGDLWSGLSLDYDEVNEFKPPLWDPKIEFIFEVPEIFRP